MKEIMNEWTGKIIIVGANLVYILCPTIRDWSQSSLHSVSCYEDWSQTSLHSVSYYKWDWSQFNL